jgi:hypothetical protein
MVAVMQADTIIAAVRGGAILHKQFVEGEIAYWLSESNGLAQVAVPVTEAKLVAASSMVKSCEPLLDNCAQSYVIQNGKVDEK